MTKSSQIWSGLLRNYLLLLLSRLDAISQWRHRSIAVPGTRRFVPRPEAEAATKPPPASIRHNAKPPWVRAVIIEFARLSPQCGCRALANLFNRCYHDIGISVGKTYVSDILREYRTKVAKPQRYAHTINTACPILANWGIDITECRTTPDIPQPIFGIIDHGSRRVLKLEAIDRKSSISILRLLLDAIEHYGKPKKIRTDNEAIFTSWVFAFALRWLGIRHERIEPGQPWMNGRIERMWSTFKQLLRMFDLKNEAELQATLDLLRETYNQHRPHQSLSGHTPVEAWHALEKRKTKPTRSRRQ